MSFVGGIPYPQAGDTTKAAAQAQEPVFFVSELDRCCEVLKENIARIASQIERTRRILCVPKAVEATIKDAPPPESQTLLEFLTFVNNKMEDCIYELDTLNDSLRTKVGELKILD